MISHEPGSLRFKMFIPYPYSLNYPLIYHMYTCLCAFLPNDHDVIITVCVSGRLYVPKQLPNANCPTVGSNNGHSVIQTEH